MTSTSKARRARDAARSFLRLRGFDVVRYEPTRFPELRRAALIENAAVDTVLDVGANDGAFALGLRRGGYSGLIVSFEPQSAAFAVLERRAAADSAWTCRQLALGASDGVASLHIAKNSSSSSSSRSATCISRAHPNLGTSARRASRSRGSTTYRSGLVEPRDRVYLKVDTQGYELEVLNGAVDTLGQVVAADIELSLAPLYEGAPLIGEVVTFLEARGLVPVWLEPAFTDPDTGRLLQIDGLFVRTP